jgi:hypothetical protein
MSEAQRDPIANWKEKYNAAKVVKAWREKYKVPEKPKRDPIANWKEKYNAAKVVEGWRKKYGLTAPAVQAPQPAGASALFPVPNRPQVEVNPRTGILPPVVPLSSIFPRTPSAFNLTPEEIGLTPEQLRERHERILLHLRQRNDAEEAEKNPGRNIGIRFEQSLGGEPGPGTPGSVVGGRHRKKKIKTHKSRSKKTRGRK